MIITRDGVAPTPRLFGPRSRQHALAPAPEGFDHNALDNSHTPAPTNMQNCQNEPAPAPACLNPPELGAGGYLLCRRVLCKPATHEFVKTNLPRSY